MLDMKKVFSWVLVLCMFSFQCARAANETISEPQYTYVSTLQVSLSLDSGTASCSGKAKANHVNSKTEIRLALQKRIIGGTKWGEVCYWTASANGLATAMISKEKAVSSGSDYRLQLKCTISDAEGVILESVTKYSSIKRVN